MNAKRAEVIALTTLLLLATAAAAQIPPPTVTAPVSLPNPSSSLVLPAPGEVSVSPATRGAPLGSGFWYGYRFPPIGQDLRLTIVSTNDNDPTRKLGGDSDTAAEDRALDSIREMYARCVPAGCHHQRIRRVTACNTPSASP
jgi:hypothetical protein